MKTKIYFFAFILAISFSLSTYAQSKPDSIQKTGTKPQDMTGMMDKPTYLASSGDLQFRIWITSHEDQNNKMEKEEHRSGMDTLVLRNMGIKNDTGSNSGNGMEMNKTMESAMAGTHQILVEVKNKVSGKETNASSVRVDLVSPTKKTSSLVLNMSMKDHFIGGITLDEKGEYQLKVSVIVGTISKTMKLKYKLN